MSSLINRYLIYSFILLLMSCIASRKSIPTATIGEYSLNETGKNEVQTKGNVTIDVKMLSPSSTYDHPELFSINPQQIDERLDNVKIHYPPDQMGKMWAFTFGYGENVLPAFKIKITNNTNHILRMRDSRIFLVIGGDNPISAAVKIGNYELELVNREKNILQPSSYIRDDKESLVYWLTYYENLWESKRKRSILDLPYPYGFASQVIKQNISSYKLVNGIDVEILPDFSYEGILVFPTLVSTADAKLMFYDIITKTDNAGNVTEKVRFEFPLKHDTVNMWYDVNQKRWLKGTPPPQTPQK
jgi:hypothetical protein